MLHQHKSFRAATGALAAIGMSLLGSFSSAAQEVKAAANEGVTIHTKCSEWKPGELMSDEKCEMLKKAAIAAERRTIADEKICLVQLLAFRKAAPDQFAALGPISRDKVCEIAAKLPRPTASSATPQFGG